MDSQSMAVAELTVSSYTDVVGPASAMLGPLVAGGILTARTVPCCWGPMITPEIRGGHEVTQPVAVLGAEVGDSVVLKIRRISIRSKATASGVDSPIAGHFHGDPSVAASCPKCGRSNPPTRLEGIGTRAIRCQDCGSEVTPFAVLNGYTIVFDTEHSFGITVDKATAEHIAARHHEFARLWSGTRQHSALVMAVADLPGVLTRIRPMIGNIGTLPAIEMPASKNAGDVAHSLLGIPHQLSLLQEDLHKRTDAHMDIDSVAEGTAVVCPVKVPGAGIYVGDVHAMQGDGEIAGHTTDVAAEVVVQVAIIKGLQLEGPLILPPVEALPPLARPYSATELSHGMRLANQLGLTLEGAVAPVQVVGTGRDLQAAVANGIERLSRLAGVSSPEIKNRITITGGIEIGRLPGVVQVTALLPLSRLEQLGLGDLYRAAYALEAG